MNITLGELGNVIADTVNEFSRDFTEKLEVVNKKIAEETKDIVKEKAPVRTSKYKKSITIKKEEMGFGRTKRTIHVKAPHYRLTHLLEHGHATRNGGRTRAFKHWKPAEDYAIKHYVDDVIEAIENGGK